MKKKRFSVEKIVSVLKDAEVRTPVADLIRKIGVLEQTFYRCKKVYGGLEQSQARWPSPRYSDIFDAWELG